MAKKKPIVPPVISAPTSKSNQEDITFVFSKENYKLLLISIVVVLLGFVLMSGSENIYSFTKIILAPIVILAGFGLGFWAIMKK